MTDFETRARGAARAVRAIADTPADELAPRRAGRGPVRAVLIAAAVIVAAAIVGTTLVTGNDDAVPAKDPRFCDELGRQLLGSGSLVRDLGFLRRAPVEIRTAATAVADAQASGIANPQAFAKLSNWYTLRCFHDVAAPNAGPADQRYGPRPVPGWFAVCRAANATPIRIVDQGRITILGDASRRDPYNGSMIAVAWRRHGTFGDDRSGRPIAVAGHPAAVILDGSAEFGGTPDTAQIIAWRESGVAVGIFGRGFGTARTAELARIVSNVRVDRSGPQVEPATIGRGYRVVFDGSFQATQILRSTAADTYEVAANGGSARLVGSRSDARTAAAARFFATTLQPTTVAGRHAWIGSLSGPAGPRNFIRWQASDRVTLTLYGSGRTEKELRTFVPATRKLNRAQWERIVNSGKGCTPTTPTAEGVSP